MNAEAIEKMIEYIKKNTSKENLKKVAKSGAKSGAFLLLGATLAVAAKPVVNIIKQSQGLTPAPLITDGTSTEIPVYDSNGKIVTNISLPCLIYVEDPQIQTILNAIKSGYHNVMYNVMLEPLHTFSDKLIEAYYIDPRNPEEKMKQGFFDPKDIGEYCDTISKKDIYIYSEIVVYTGNTGIYPNSTGQMVKLIHGDSYLCKGTPWLDDFTDTKQSEILDAATYQTISVSNDQLEPLFLENVVTIRKTKIFSPKNKTISEVNEGTLLDLLSSTLTSSHYQLVRQSGTNIIGFVNPDDFVSYDILKNVEPWKSNNSGTGVGRDE